MEQYNHKLDQGIQRMYGIAMYTDDKGVSEQFPEPTSLPSNCRKNAILGGNLQMSEVLNIESQHGFINDIPQCPVVDVS